MVASSLVWFCSAYAALSESAPVDVWEHCRSDDSCTIEYDRLSTQGDEPYLFLGYVMDSEQARWNQFRKAIHAYPNVQSCLIEEERNKKQPNLLKFDWDSVGTGQEAAVCVFRIARSLSNQDRIQNWFAYHQFEVAGPHRYRSKSFVPTRENQPVASMTGYWTVEQYRKQTPSMIRTLTGFDTVIRYEVILSFSEENQTVGASVLATTK